MPRPSRWLLGLLLLALAGLAHAAPRIGVVTMEPGEVFFERFGHNAIVVVPADGSQALAYNFGYFDLEEPIVNNIYVDLPRSARDVYRDLEKEMFAELDGFEIEAVHAAARTSKCLQAASGAIYVDDTGQWRELHDEKIRALESVIEEAAGMPVLVAYHFKSDLVRLQAAFKQGRALDKEPQTIRDWNAGKIPLMFIHPLSAGHGLSLQDGGNILAFFSLDWNLETYMQVIERIGPMRQKQAGYDRPVFVHHIVARNTVDEMVLDRLQSKRSVQEVLLEAMERRG
jgi:SNF2 family DNA or RNA helicase